jgi:pilus assembly protein TadC
MISRAAFFLFYINPLFLKSLIIAYIAILAMSLFFYKFNFCC